MAKAMAAVFMTAGGVAPAADTAAGSDEVRACNAAVPMIGQIIGTLRFYLSHVARFHRYSSGPCLWLCIQRRQKASCTRNMTMPMAKLSVVVA